MSIQRELIFIISVAIYCYVSIAVEYKDIPPIELDDPFPHQFPISPSYYTQKNVRQFKETLSACAFPRKDPGEEEHFVYVIVRGTSKGPEKDSIRYISQTQLDGWWETMEKQEEVWADTLYAEKRKKPKTLQDKELIEDLSTKLEEFDEGFGHSSLISTENYAKYLDKPRSYKIMYAGGFEINTSKKWKKSKKCMKSYDHFSGHFESKGRYLPAVVEHWGFQGEAPGAVFHSKAHYKNEYLMDEYVDNEELKMGSDDADIPPCYGQNVDNDYSLILVIALITFLLLTLVCLAVCGCFGVGWFLFAKEAVKKQADEHKTSRSYQEL